MLLNEFNGRMLIHDDVEGGDKWHIEAPMPNVRDALVAAMISDSEMPDIEPPGFRNYKFVPSFPHMYAVNKLVKSIVKDHLADTGFSSDPYFETVEAQRYVDVRVSRSR